MIYSCDRNVAKGNSNSSNNYGSDFMNLIQKNS